MNEKDERLPLLVKLCSDNAAYEAIPRRRVFFNMNTVGELFEASQNFEIVVHTPYIIILRSGEGGEVTFSEDGRMLLKEMSSKEEAITLAYDVLDVASKAMKPR